MPVCAPRCSARSPRWRANRRSATSGAWPGAPVRRRGQGENPAWEGEPGFGDATWVIGQDAGTLLKSTPMWLLGTRGRLNPATAYRIEYVTTDARERAITATGAYFHSHSPWRAVPGPSSRSPPRRRGWPSTATPPTRARWAPTCSSPGRTTPSRRTSCR
ncbi:hypothetical protein QP028_15890 [Corynebacterium suedekumii]|nr:hypothetical protein QP028_15890 [Corynebacterium suedekumii]